MQYAELLEKYKDRPSFVRSIRTAREEAQNCAVCRGLDECRNSGRGMMYIVRDGQYGPEEYVQNCRYAVAERAQKKMEGVLGASRLGKRFWNRTFGNFNVTKDTEIAYKAAHDYAEDFPDVKKWLLLSGKVGTGKTHLAVAVLHAVAEKGYQPIFMPSTDMMLRLKSSYQAEDTREYIDSLTNADLLIIDDLGKERADEKAREFLFSVLNARYEGDRPTIITTNLTGPEIRQVYGDALLSRFAEVGVIAPMMGEDYRRVI